MLFTVYTVLIRELAVKFYKIYAAQIDALPSNNGRLQKIDRTINVHETDSVVRSNVSWIDLQSFKVNSLVP